MISIGNHDLTGLVLGYVETELALRHSLGMSETEALATMAAAKDAGAVTVGRLGAYTLTYVWPRYRVRRARRRLRELRVQLAASRDALQRARDLSARPAARTRQHERRAVV